MNRVNLPAAFLVILILGIWETAVRLLAVPAFILPAPSSILTVAITLAPRIFPHAVVTFAEILLGIGLAVITAVPLAIVMFAKPFLEKAFSPFLVASQAIPVFALAPLLVVWFGYGIASKVFMAWIIIFFPICVSLLEGFKSCDPEYRILFRLMGASFYKTLTLLYWPWALPRFFAGLKVGVGVAGIGAVIGEWVGAQKGLGFFMIQSNARLQVDLVFAAILWLTAMGLALWWLTGVLEKIIIKWK
ncbi:MAG: ABC transporter permease [Desulfobacula sp.]|jgi:putative hydroxymethylpyrimidine transport system permease protein